MSTPRLTRDLRETGSAPVRMVHLGLGNFHRAHQAWHTHTAPDSQEWGIAAFTGRRPDMAQALAPQDGLFTLITRSDGDSFNVVESIVAVHGADEHQAYLDYLGRSEVAIVTITLTEHAYVRGSDGGLDAQREDVCADLDALSADTSAQVHTLPGRLVAGLLARREAGAGPIAVLSCDNLADNGAVTKRITLEFAAQIEEDLASWIEQNVSFATSMVDRITPATTDEDLDAVTAHQGYRDASPVPTEPFSEWVISGQFPAGHPAWEEAGVQFVDDVSVHERRKLWMLNGSHSLLAYTAPLLGHQRIDQAIGDPRALGWVNTLWDEAAEHLGLPADTVQAYRDDLLARYRNTGIRHQLAQIAKDGSQKVGVRIIPQVHAQRAAGRVGTGVSYALAGWVLHLQGYGAPVADSGAGPAQEAARASDPAAAATGVLGTLDPELAQDAEVVSAVVEAYTDLRGLSEAREG